MDYEEIRLRKIRRFNKRAKRNRQNYKSICCIIPLIWIAAGLSCTNGGWICLFFASVFSMQLMKAWPKM